MRRLVVLWGAVVAVVAAGCATYRPEPLVPAQEWAALNAVRVDDFAATPLDGSAPVPMHAAPFDYADGLSMDEAAALALRLNPDMRAMRVQQDIAEAQLISAGMFPNPEVETRWLEPAEGSSVVGETNLLFNLTDALIVRPLEQARARLALQAVRWEIAEREWQLVNDVWLAALDLAFWEQAVELYHEQREIAERTRRTVAARRDAGVATEIEALLAETEVAELDREGARIRGNRTQALHTLNRVLGLPPAHATRLQERRGKLAYFAPPGDREHLADELPHRRPAVLQAQQAYDAAERALALAIRKQIPDLSIGPSHEREGSVDTFGVAVSVDFPLFNRNQGEIAVQRAEREQRRQEYIVAMHEARGQFHENWAAMDTVEEDLALYRDNVAPKLQRSAELTRAAFEFGEFDVFQLLLIQARVLEGQRDMLEKLRDIQRARVDVLRAVGPAPAPADR